MHNRNHSTRNETDKMKIAVVGGGGIESPGIINHFGLSPTIVFGEIEYQNGIIVRLGLQYGIDTPVNKFVYNCILPMEIKARKFKT